MGVWGGLCVFDYSLYLKSVVPAFQCGESHPFIQQISAKLAQSGYEDVRFQGLADVISHCNNSITTCNLAKEFQVVDGKVQLATKQNPAQWGYESFIRLFEWAVTTQCVSHYTIFGLSVSHLGRNLFPKVMEWDQLTLELIAQLDTRTQFWAHDSGGYGEGIQGWLDPEETELLALSLPALVPNTQQADAQNMLQKKVHTYHQIDGSKKPISHLEMLNRFGRLLQIAVDQGCGLLWGRDLDLFYEQSRRMMFAVPEQIPIEVLIEKPPQPVDPTPVPARVLQKKLAVPIRSQPHKRIKAEAFANMDLQTVCAYLTDPYWANRVKAVQALGNLGDLQAIKPLIACLQDENGVVFKTAVSTLGQIGGHEASAALVIALFEQDRYFDAHEPTPHSSTYITTALKRMPETAVPFLLAALTNKQWATTGRTGRWRAAYVLGVLRVKTAVPDLLRLLREGDDDVRPSIATALGAIGDPVALSGLQAAAQQDPLSTVRASAKRAASLL